VMEHTATYADESRALRLRWPVTSVSAHRPVPTLPERAARDLASIAMSVITISAC
jgi:hypothetical protein